MANDWTPSGLLHASRADPPMATLGEVDRTYDATG